MLRLYYYGPLSDVSGHRETTLKFPENETTIADIIDQLERENKPLGEALRHSAVRVALNKKVEEVTAVVSDNDEIAFLPPFSGG